MTRPYSVRKRNEKRPMVIRPFNDAERKASIIREEKNGLQKEKRQKKGLQ